MSSFSPWIRCPIRPLACSIVVAMMSLASVARAESGNDALALKNFEQGRRLFEARSYDEALRAFEASLDALPSPNTRLYLARCLREKGKIASAHSMFRVASREAEDRVRATGDKRYAATQRSAALEADRLAPFVPRVTLRLEPGPGALGVDVGRASIAVDGALLSPAEVAGPLELDPGPHTVTVSGPHLKRTEMPVSVALQDAKTIAIAVERTPFGTLRIDLKTKPAGLAAELDGEPLDLRSPIETREVTIGPHRFAARAPGYSTFLWEASVDDASSVDVTVNLAAAPIGPAIAARDASPSGTPKWLFFATAGVAVVALGAGGYFVADARARERDEEDKVVSARDPAARDDVRARAQVGSALLIGGGVLAVAATALAVTTRWRSTTTNTALTLTPRAGADQLLLGGVF